MKKTNHKRSKGELKRLVIVAVERVCRVPRSGLLLNIDEIESSGSPPSSIRAWATLHFTKEGSPFCCGEPACHLCLTEDSLEEIGDEVRRAMGLRQRVDVQFASLGVLYHDGVSFGYGEGQSPDHSI